VRALSRHVGGEFVDRNDTDELNVLASVPFRIRAALDPVAGAQAVLADLGARDVDVRGAATVAISADEAVAVAEFDKAGYRAGIGRDLWQDWVSVLNRGTAGGAPAPRLA
jgi:hypothetical protein